jgi:hypothetical protein
MAERPEVSPLDIAIVRGHPTPEELAALVAVLQPRQAPSAADAGPSGGAAGPSGRPGAAPSAWSAPASLHRRPLPLPSPGAWAWRRATP